MGVRGEESRLKGYRYYMGLLLGERGDAGMMGLLGKRGDTGMMGLLGERGASVPFASRNRA